MKTLLEYLKIKMRRLIQANFKIFLVIFKIIKWHFYILGSLFIFVFVLSKVLSGDKVLPYEVFAIIGTVLFLLTLKLINKRLEIIRDDINGHELGKFWKYIDKSTEDALGPRPVSDDIEYPENYLT